MKTTITMPNGETKTRKGEYSHVLLVKYEGASEWTLRNWCGSLNTAMSNQARFHELATYGNPDGETIIMEA